MKILIIKDTRPYIKSMMKYTGDQILKIKSVAPDIEVDVIEPDKSAI